MAWCAVSVYTPCGTSLNVNWPRALVVIASGRPAMVTEAFCSGRPRMLSNTMPRTAKPTRWPEAAAEMVLTPSSAQRLSERIVINGGTSAVTIHGRPLYAPRWENAQGRASQRLSPQHLLQILPCFRVVRVGREGLTEFQCRLGELRLLGKGDAPVEIG